MAKKNDVEAELLRHSGEETISSNLAVPGTILPSRLLILPLTERPFFPAQTLPVLMDEQPWIETLEKAAETPQKVVGLMLVAPNFTDNIHKEDFYPVGTVARLHQPMRTGDKIQFIAEGIRRVRIVNWITKTQPFLAQVAYPDEPRDENIDELKAYGMAIINTLKELVPLNPLYSEELKFFLNRFGPNEPSPLVDFAAGLTTSSKEELQDVLETFSIRHRMEKVLVLIKKELQVAKLQAQIRKSVEEKITEQQRNFFLREQLKVIQKELGLAKDDRSADLERFQERLKALTIPPDVQSRIDDEMQKLSILESGSPEYAVTRNYLDLISLLPWGKYSTDQLDLAGARKILDRDHDGLDDIKQRIIEFLAVGALKGEVAGSILLFVGPPGVGKTSIGRSIANALGRKFYRFSLGGMRDEAEIKGHRRTYIGAMPGKFIQAIKEVNVANPVIMLDEIDKIGASFRGDPGSALLEVLDPEQNKDFLDHYLDTRFDLSRVLFICTANQLDTIPAPLLDRMEIIRLAGYITEEKLQIAKNHLWPRQLEKAGLTKGKLKISEAALRQIIEDYAREAGVRNLEKQLSSIVRKAVVVFVDGRKQPISVGTKDIETYLGKPIFQKERPLNGVGVVTGLAWTPLGGVTLHVEASRIHTKHRGFQLTGKLGDVMKESAEIAYSYVAANLKKYHSDKDFFDFAFVHLHVPEGATPKDGPSAGITMASALLSLVRREKIARPIAMTGELTLTGQILAVGGIREKVIAARRSKVFELILPEANQRDLAELPEYIKEGFTFHWVSRYREVVSIIFPR